MSDLKRLRAWASMGGVTLDELFTRLEQLAIIRIERDPVIAKLFRAEYAVLDERKFQAFRSCMELGLPIKDALAVLTQESE